MKVDFATFCYKGDVHRLHVSGQLKRQVESNNYLFNKIMVIYQELYPDYYYSSIFSIPVETHVIVDVTSTLQNLGIDINKPQYTSTTDKAHIWKYHVVNHLAAVQKSNADYIVFADNDCWMVRQPPNDSWIYEAIDIFEQHPDCFIVSPNDGETMRKTQRMSQQMFIARVDEFRSANFNQPGWDGNVNVLGGPMPEYWAMLEGRMELHCRAAGKYRYVLGAEYRYWHWNLLTQDGFFETDMSKY